MNRELLDSAPVRLSLVAALLVGPSHGLAAQASWDVYAPARLAAVIAQEQAALADSTLPAEITRIAAGPVRLRVLVTFTGRTRRIPPEHTALLRQWATALGLGPEIPSLFTAEHLFREDSLEFWIPVQDVLLTHLSAELAPGDSVLVFLGYVGAARRRGVVDWLFVVNEFQKP